MNQALGIMQATQYAAAIGLPLNRHVTIHWERAGILDCRAAAATARFMKLASDWIATRSSPLEKLSRNQLAGGSQFAWVWVRENDITGESFKGSHVHILLHLPADVTWGGWRVRRWLERISQKPYRAGIIKTARIRGPVRTAPDNTDVYQANLAAIVGYILKGACPAAGQALALERLQAGGPVLGRRASTSQNIGRSARARFNNGK